MTWGSDAWGTAAWGAPGGLQLFVRTTNDEAGQVAPRPRSIVSRPHRAVFSTREILPPGETIAQVQVIRRSSANAVTTSDGGTRKVTAKRTSPDSAPVSDALIRMLLARRTVADATSASDVAIRRTTWARSTTDSLASPAEIALRMLLAKRLTADTATAGDVPNGYWFSGGSETVPVPIDTVHAKQMLKRSGADLGPAADQVTSPTSRQRTAADSAPATDALTRLRLLRRLTVDSLLAVVDSATNQRTLYGTASDSASALDGLFRRLDARRAPQDGAPASEAASRASVLLRRSNDTAQAVDAVHSPSWLRRWTDQSNAFYADALDAPVASAVRVLLLRRQVEDQALAYDQGWKEIAQDLREVLPAPVDTATRKVFEYRLSSDAAPVLDGIQRVGWFIRLISEATTSFDVVARVLGARRQAVDLEVTTDAPTRVVAQGRTSNDEASAWEVGVRWKRALRSGAEVLGLTDAGQRSILRTRLLTEMAGPALDVLGSALAQYRRGAEWLLAPSDRANQDTEHPLPFGPPRPEIVAASATKIGRDCETVQVVFTFDQPVIAWVVRINSTGPHDGAPADGWTMERTGLGQQPFGRAPFGRSVGDERGFGHTPFGRRGFGRRTRTAPAHAGRAEISSRHLLHGANDVAVYGRSPRGVWTTACPDSASTSKGVT